MIPDLDRILRLDGAANVLGGAALVALAGPARDLLGLAATWPLYVVAVAVGLYGVDQWVSAGRATAGAVRGFAALDAVAGVALVVLAATDPTGAPTALRWVLAATGDVVLAVGAVKLYALRRGRATAG